LLQAKPGRPGFQNPTCCIINWKYYELEDDAWVCVRPSGTEPKVKFYIGVKGTSMADADEKSASLGSQVLDMIQKMI